MTNATIAMIEALRDVGVKITTACDLAAEELNVDPEVLAVSHFAWLLDQHGATHEPQGEAA